LCSEGDARPVCEDCEGCQTVTECPPNGSTGDDLWACDLVVSLPANATHCISLVALPVGSTVEVIDGPSHGALDAETGCYTPAAGYCGSDSFQFRGRTDDGALSRTATVSIDVWCNEPGQECMSYFQCYDRQISPAGDQDPLVFAGIAGQRITAYLSHANTCGMALRLEGPGTSALCDTSVSPRCTNTSTYNSCFFSGSTNPYPDVQIDDFALPATGTYRIIVDGCGGCTGNYRLCLFRHDVPTSVSFGQTISQGVGLGDQDAFVFAGTAGQRMNAYLNHANTCGMALRLEGPGISALCDTSVSPRCTNTSTYNSCFFSGSTNPYPDVQIDDFALPATGTYRIIVDGCGGCTGNYDFSLTCTGNCPETTCDCGTPGFLCSGDNAEGQLASPSDSLTYMFCGRAGQRVLIRATESVGSDFNPELVLYPPDDGPAETSAWWYDSATIDHSLSQSGTYRLLVRDHWGTAAGAYHLTYHRF
jgi:hypothetical protein